MTVVDDTFATFSAQSLRSAAPFSVTIVKPDPLWASAPVPAASSVDHQVDSLSRPRASCSGATPAALRATLNRRSSSASKAPSWETSWVTTGSGAVVAAGVGAAVADPARAVGISSPPTTAVTARPATDRRTAATLMAVRADELREENMGSLSGRCMLVTESHASDYAT